MARAAPRRSLTLELLTTVVGESKNKTTALSSVARADVAADATRPWLEDLRRNWHGGDDLPVVALGTSPNQAAMVLACWGGECVVIPLLRKVLPATVPKGTRAPASSVTWRRGEGAHPNESEWRICAAACLPTRSGVYCPAGSLSWLPAHVPIYIAQALVLSLERQRSNWDLIRVVRDLQDELAMPALVDDALVSLFTYYGSRPDSYVAPPPPSPSASLALAPGAPFAVDTAAAMSTPGSVRSSSMDGTTPTVRYLARPGQPMAEERVSMLFALQAELLR